MRSVAAVMNSPMIEELRKKEVELEHEEGELAADYGQEHPRMRMLRESKAKLSREIGYEIDRVVGGVEDDLSEIKAREQNIRESLELSRATHDLQSQAAVELRELEREAAAKQVRYEALLTRYQETKSQEGMLLPDAHVVSLAGVPSGPSSPSPTAFGVLGLALSIVLGIMMALLTEHADGTARSIRQIEALFKLPLLSLVPKIRKRRSRPLYGHLLNKSRSSYSEAIHSLYRWAFGGGSGQPSRRVLVTSSLPNEGKTSLAVSLAVRCAGLGRKTIVVDFDLRRPSIAREFDISPERDLVAYLCGSAELDQVIMGDENTGLDILGTNCSGHNVAHLLMSPRLTLLFADLSARYDCIIVDTPPALGIGDAQTLASYVDTMNCRDPVAENEGGGDCSDVEGAGGSAGPKSWNGIHSG